MKKPFKPLLLAILSSSLTSTGIIANEGNTDPYYTGNMAIPNHYEVAQNNPKATDDGPGTAGLPWKTISKAAESVNPGDEVIIHEGVYRERIVIKTSGTAKEPIRFEAAPGERVVITGADQMTGWTKLPSENPIFTIAWPYSFINNSKTGSMIHPNDAYHKLIGRCEQVIVNGYLLKQVLSSSQLAPGTFFADADNKLLYVWEATNRDMNSRDIYAEASVRSEILRIEGAYVQVRGLQFRFAANFAQRGAVILAGNHGVLEDCLIEQMNACGISFRAPDLLVRRCTIRDNGQLGFGGSGAHRLLFTECTVENNNTKNYSRQWEAGGDKLTLCRGVTLEKSKFLRNRGTGIWFDIGNDSCTIRQCYIADNEASGIFYEISYRLFAYDNVIVGNGFAVDPGNWGVTAGISLSSSPGCVIERNLLVGNREGFAFREQYRTTPIIGDRTERAVWNHDEIIRNNIIAYNRDAQVYAWFNQKDERHFPSPIPGKVTLKTDEIKRDENGQPVGLTLEDLNIRFENNSYFAYPNQGMIKWGPSFSKNQRVYPTVAEFQKDLKIDAGGKTIEPMFYNLLARDYRLSKKTMTILKGNYPKGTVPGVNLGTQQ
jgi:hypothetical protein